MEKQSYIGKNSREAKERFTPLKRATAGVLASLALTSTLYTAHEGSHEAKRQEVITEVAERYLSHDNVADKLHFSPEYTIVVPAISEAKPYDIRFQFNDEAQLRAEGQWCNTPDIPLFQKATAEQIDAASEIKMGLDTKQYEAITAQLDAAKTVEEAEDIAKTVYKGLGIELTFNANIENYHLDHVKPVAQSPNYMLRRFVSDLDDQISSLTVMPIEMVSAVKKADLIFADSMYSYNKDGSKHGADGTFNGTHNEVTVRLGSGGGVSVHEWAHALHNKSCNEFSGGKDGGFEAAYSQALALIQNDPKAKKLEKTWPEDVPGQKAWYSKEYFDETGFPTKYSRNNYVELFADATTALLTQGALAGHESGKSIEAGALQQLVVDRLQKAMPHTDIASLVAARSVYPDEGYGAETFQAMLDNHVSRIDRIFAGEFGKLEDGAKVVPAINIKSADGALDEILYSYQKDVQHTPKGLDGGLYTMSFLKSQNNTFDNTLIDMSLKYLLQTANQKNITLRYEAREFDESYYILATYENDGLSSDKPSVMHSKFVDSPASAKGGTLEGPTGTGG